MKELRARLDIPTECVAAVGDSAGDIDLLRIVTHPIYVGKNLPPGLEGMLHLPDGDILSVSKHILSKFGKEI